MDLETRQTNKTYPAARAPETYESVCFCLPQTGYIYIYESIYTIRTIYYIPGSSFRGAEWMIRGASTPSFRVQTAPFRRCWYVIVAIYYIYSYFKTNSNFIYHLNLYYRPSTIQYESRLLQQILMLPISRWYRFMWVDELFPYERMTHRTLGRIPAGLLTCGFAQSNTRVYRISGFLLSIFCSSEKIPTKRTEKDVTLIGL